MSDIDSNQHVVRTSSQWNERSDEYWVVPRGCLCIELTPKGQTKLKIGEGNKIYSQLPYVSDADLSKYYTIEEVNNIINNLQYMSIKSTMEYNYPDDLPSTGNSLGDVRFVKSQSAIKTDPDTYVWNGNKWILVGSPLQDVDLSEYVKKKDFDIVKEKVDEMYPKMHTHDNKDILDKVEEPFTTEEKEKLDSLHNYDDSELRDLIKSTGHTHPNKDVLDKIEVPFTFQDKNKLDSLENYNDTCLKDRLTAVEKVAHWHDNKDVLDQLTQDKLDAYDEVVSYSFEVREHLETLDTTVSTLKQEAHTHPNKDILDHTTAVYTIEDYNLLHYLETITIFDGAGEDYDGIRGYVPAPKAGQQNAFLRGDGKWVAITDLGEYKQGIGIEFEYKDDPDNNMSGTYINNTGVLDVNGKEEDVGVITVTTKDGDKDIDLLENLNKLILNCNNSPD